MMGWSILDIIDDDANGRKFLGAMSFMLIGAQIFA